MKATELLAAGMQGAEAVVALCMRDAREKGGKFFVGGAETSGATMTRTMRAAFKAAGAEIEKFQYPAVWEPRNRGLLMGGTPLSTYSPAGGMTAEGTRWPAEGGVRLVKEKEAEEEEAGTGEPGWLLADLCSDVMESVFFEHTRDEWPSVSATLSWPFAGPKLPQGMFPLTKSGDVMIRGAVGVTADWRLRNSRTMDPWAGYSLAYSVGCVGQFLSRVKLWSGTIQQAKMPAAICLAALWNSLVDALREKPCPQARRAAMLEAFLGAKPAEETSRRPGRELETQFRAIVDYARARMKAVEPALETIEKEREALIVQIEAFKRTLARKESWLLERLEVARREGLIEDAVVTETHSWIKLPPLRWTLAERTTSVRTGVSCKAGVYETPRAIIRIQHGTSGGSAFIFGTDGGVHPHPHVSIYSDGHPCWGEGEDRERHMALANAAWAEDPRQFCLFMRGYLTEATDARLYRALAETCTWVGPVVTQPPPPPPAAAGEAAEEFVPRVVEA